MKTFPKEPGIPLSTPKPLEAALGDTRV